MFEANPCCSDGFRAQENTGLIQQKGRKGILLSGPGCFSNPIGPTVRTQFAKPASGCSTGKFTAFTDFWLRKFGSQILPENLSLISKQPI
jgi:hypothetical protein